MLQVNELKTQGSSRGARDVSIRVKVSCQRQSHVSEHHPESRHQNILNSQLRKRHPQPLTEYIKLPGTTTYFPFIYYLPNQPSNYILIYPPLFISTATLPVQATTTSVGFTQKKCPKTTDYISNSGEPFSCWQVLLVARRIRWEHGHRTASHKPPTLSKTSQL